MSAENSATLPGEIESKGSVVSFNPPVYIQRYMTIANLLQSEPWKHQISKVVDFGCAELKLFKYLKRIDNISHIFAVDADKNSILNNLHAVKPFLYEYIAGFTKQLTVDLFCGSIAEPDERLADVDAVICIELIEHLYENVLDLVPSTVFEFLKPKLAVFTTPNADFNVLFDLDKFRHDDHKFEWTRAEFQSWCNDIILRYQNYEVSFEGIGCGPEGTEHLGCCSQMAIFKLKCDHSIDFQKNQILNEPYELLYSIEYPFKKDLRSEDEKFIDELNFQISSVITSKKGVDFQRYDSKYEIPINYLFKVLQKCCSTEELLVEKLTHGGYLVDENDENVPVLIYDAFQNHESDSDQSFDEFINESTSSMTETGWANSADYDENWAC